MPVTGPVPVLVVVVVVVAELLLGNFAHLPDGALAVH